MEKFVIGVAVGFAITIALLVNFPKNRFYVNGYQHGVADAKAGNVKLEIDTLIIAR